MLAFGMDDNLKDPLMGTFNVRIGESAIGNNENGNFVSLKCTRHEQFQSNINRQLCSRLCGQVSREFDS